MDAPLKIAAQRDLTLEDIGMDAETPPEAVRAKCDAIAKALMTEYLLNRIDWQEADLIANNLHDLMFCRCGSRVPDFAWDVYLAFDDAEANSQGDAFTRPRLTELSASKSLPNASLERKRER